MQSRGTMENELEEKSFMINKANCSKCCYHRKTSMKYRVYEPFCVRAYSTIRELKYCPRVRDFKKLKKTSKDVENILFPETENLED